MNKLSQNLQLRILAIDTSCDETAAAVTEGTTVLSNVVWSQASQHAKFGGVMPSLAQRMHEERIDWVVNKAIQDSKLKIQDFGAVAVTAGPGLAIALGVGIECARKLASKLSIPLIPVNHTEGHLLSPLARPKTSPLSPLLNSGEGNLFDVNFPALGLVVSGGHTELVLIKSVGEYQILAKTQDDALGEALDKAARMLGLGYPGGAILEKMARSAGSGQAHSYPLPLPMAGREDQNSFSYSGLKTAFYRLIEEEKVNSKSNSLDKQQMYDLAASFQNRAFEHLIRVVNNTLSNPPFNLRGGNERSDISDVKDFLVGGGVAANVELRKRLRKMSKELDLKVRFPYSTKLAGDNAAMVGIAAGFKIQDLRFKIQNINQIDRRARWSVENDYFEI